MFEIFISLAQYNGNNRAGVLLLKTIVLVLRFYHFRLIVGACGALRTRLEHFEDLSFPHLAQNLRMIT